MLRRGFAVGALVAAFVSATSATAAAPPLATQLARALTVPNVAPSLSGAVAVDLANGATIFARNADTPLAPASNEKLPISFAALTALGPWYRFRTEVLGIGHQDGPVWRGDLVLKGYGDPTLSSLGLARLAGQLAESGIRTVTGRVLGDESWFDARRVGTGWKARFYINESPPLSALTVDRDRYHGRVESMPAVAAAARFQEVLHARGITAGAPAAGRAPVGAYALATVYSVPLPEILTFMDRESDNFTAELVLKAVGAEAGDAGTAAAGAEVVLRTLALSGIPTAGVRIVDGSGLSLDDRITPRALAALLVVAWNDLDLHEPLRAALAVAGVNGTLVDRMRRAPARGAVLAKTGTTNSASALSGYARGRFAFAVVQNGRPVSTSWARTAQDRFAQVLAATP